nr:uncharacterized protein LOC128698339 [Cherax quadricarinatus]
MKKVNGILQVQEYLVGVLVCLHTCIKQEFPASFCASPCCSHYFNTIEEAKEAPAVKSDILPRYHHQYYQPAIWKSKHTCCTFHNVLHMCALLHNLYKSDPILQYSPTTALPCNMLQPQPHPAVFSNHSTTLQYAPTTAPPCSILQPQHHPAICSNHSTTLQYAPTTAPPCSILQPQPHPAVFSNHSTTLQYAPTTALPWSILQPQPHPAVFSNHSPTLQYSPTTAPPCNMLQPQPYPGVFSNHSPSIDVRESAIGAALLQASEGQCLQPIAY